MALDELAHASGPAAAAAPRWARADASMSAVSPAIDAHPPEASRSSLGSRSRHPNEDERGRLDREYLLSLRGELPKVATPWPHGGNRSAPCRHWRRRNG